MPIISISIVEDDVIIADDLADMLVSLGYEVAWHATRYGEAVEMLAEKTPDLLLLDVQLIGKLDGIDLAKFVQEQYAIPFIFLTANSDIITIERAKTVKPLAYLTKPFTKSLLFSAIEIAFDNFNGLIERKSSRDINSKYDEAIFVKDGNGYQKVICADIAFIQSEGNYLLIKMKDSKQIVVRATLAEMLSSLDQRIFVRIHRSYAVNSKQIEKVFTDEIIVLGTALPLSKSYREELKQTLGIHS